MPAISFQRQFLDALLRGDKRQTTRKQTDRIKVGDVCNIYIEQRSRIMDKPMRRATQIGQDMIISKIMDQKWPVVPNRVYINPEYYAHFLGKVEITEVGDICPCEMSDEELEAWALVDGFNDFDTVVIDAAFLDTRNSYANWWFSERYGNEWQQQTWTVIRWDEWAERYFEPKP